MLEYEIKKHELESSTSFVSGSFAFILFHIVLKIFFIKCFLFKHRLLLKEFFILCEYFLATFFFKEIIGGVHLIASSFFELILGNVLCRLVVSFHYFHHLEQTNCEIISHNATYGDGTHPKKRLVYVFELRIYESYCQIVLYFAAYVNDKNETADEFDKCQQVFPTLHAFGRHQQCFFLFEPFFSLRDFFVKIFFFLFYLFLFFS
jgi:hypothetical protein